MAHHTSILISCALFLSGCLVPASFTATGEGNCVDDSQCDQGMLCAEGLCIDWWRDYKRIEAHAVGLSPTGMNCRRTNDDAILRFAITSSLNQSVHHGDMPPRTPAFKIPSDGVRFHDASLLNHAAGSCEDGDDLCEVPVNIETIGVPRFREVPAKTRSVTMLVENTHQLSHPTLDHISFTRRSVAELAAGASWSLWEFGDELSVIEPWSVLDSNATEQTIELGEPGQLARVHDAIDDLLERGDGFAALGSGEHILIVLLDGPDDTAPDNPRVDATIAAANNAGVRLHFVQTGRIPTDTPAPDIARYVEGADRLCETSSECETHEICREPIGLPELSGKRCALDRDQRGSIRPIASWAKMACATNGIYTYIPANDVHTIPPNIPATLGGYWEIPISIDGLNDPELPPDASYNIKAMMEIETSWEPVAVQIGRQFSRNISTVPALRAD